jgi:hypothetical protein
MWQKYQSGFYSEKQKKYSERPDPKIRAKEMARSALCDDNFTYTWTHTDFQK